MNVVMTGSGRFIEVQGTAEGLPFTRDELGSLLDLGVKGIEEIVSLQQEMTSEPPPPRPSSRTSGVDAARLGVGQPRQGGRDRGDPRAGRHRVGAAASRRSPTSSRTARRSRSNAATQSASRCAHATGSAAVADDTGLEVDALGGAPGVRTATVRGRARDVRRQRDEAARRARPTCRSRRSEPRGSGRSRWRGFPTDARCWPTDRSKARSHSAPAATAGSATTPSSCPHEGDGRTFAEMSADEKHAISHRGRAFRALAEQLADSPVTKIDVPHVDDVVAVDHVHAFVLRDRRVDVRGDDAHAVADLGGRAAL